MVFHFIIAALFICINFVEQAFSAESQEFAQRVAAEHCSTDACRHRLEQLLRSSRGLTRNIGHEGPSTEGTNNSWHPASRATCVNKVLQSGVISENDLNKQMCGARWMVPVPVKGRSPSTAKVCIDQFEFPNLPCEYPVVWTSASEAQRICQSMGKRLCNSFEWEGACAGGIETRTPFAGQRGEHNAQREKVWAFQWIASLANTTESRGTCGVYTPNDPEIAPEVRGKYTAIGTSLGCDPAKSAMRTCGSNTWPSGFKHNCVSPLGVYDMHGNVAEVTNLPTSANDIADASGRTGVNEHKGSFFLYRGNYPDDCRVRQPAEHQFPISRDTGHAFYQEGFRCCKDI